MKITTGLSLIILLGLLACNSSETPANAQQVLEQNSDSPAQISGRMQLEEFAEKLQVGNTIQLVDVRTPEEYQAGYIEGALNMNVNGPNFSSQIANLDKEKPVLLYCKAGGRSQKAMQILTEQGFQEVYDLKGGYTAWMKSGQVTE